MKTEKVIEELYLPDWHTTAIITKNAVRVKLWHYRYYTEEECMDYIHQNMKGWVQSTNSYRKAMKEGTATGATDYLIDYENLYKELKKA